MNICFDVGNTSIKIGLYKNNQLVKKVSFLTDRLMHKGTLISLFKTYFDNVHEEKINVILSNVVPSLNDVLKEGINEYFHPLKLLVLDSSNAYNLQVNIDNPKELGSDLIADLVGSKIKYTCPLVICDLGTATKVLYIDENGIFQSAIIAIGLSSSATKLTDAAELLPRFSLKAKDSVIAKNTIDAMNVGIVNGHIAMIEGLVKKMKKKINVNVNTSLRGGDANYIKDITDSSFIFDETLALDGLNYILNSHLKEE